MKEYPDFWSVILGKQPIGLILGYIAISYISAIGMILIMASQKYKNIPDSPDKWSWKYFLTNNSGNFLACLFIMPIMIRLITEFLTDARILLLVSIGVGFGFYKLAKLANDIGLWTTDKLSQKVAQKINSEKDI